MPIVKRDGIFPAWCEMASFSVVPIDRAPYLGQSGDKEHLIVCSGSVHLTAGPMVRDLVEGSRIDLEAPTDYVLSSIGPAPATVLRASGRWKSITSSGVFTCRSGSPPAHDSPYSYRKTTSFDNHYHDCDEYWVVLEGACTVASEGRVYEVGPGDCIATGMGWHHDVIACGSDEGIRAVWLETTLEGRMRKGHLWVPVHGEAEPRRDRI